MSAWVGSASFLGTQGSSISVSKTYLAQDEDWSALTVREPAWERTIDYLLGDTTCVSLSAIDACGGRLFIRLCGGMGYEWALSRVLRISAQLPTL
jgi:hypothetical protein